MRFIGFLAAFFRAQTGRLPSAPASDLGRPAPYAPGHERLAQHQTTLDMLMREEAVRTGTSHEAMRVLAKALARDTGTDRVGFWLLNETNDRFTHLEVYVATHDRFEPPRAALDPGYAAVMVRDVGREVVVIDDSTRPGRFTELVTRVGHHATPVSVLFAPITTCGKLVGYITCRTTGRLIDWCEEHKLFCATIANLLALVLERQERLRSDETIKESRSRLVIQQEALGRALRHDTFRRGSLAEAIGLLNELAAEVLGVDRASVWERDDSRHALICIDSFDAEQATHIRNRLMTGAPYDWLRAGHSSTQVFAVDDVDAAPSTGHDLIAALRAKGFRSALDAPIVLDGSVVGVLALRKKSSPTAWSMDQQLFAMALANMAAIQLERQVRQRAESGLREEVEERRRTHRESEARRDRLAAHQATLAELMREDAVRLGTMEEAMRALAKALARDTGLERIGFRLLDETKRRFVYNEVYVAREDKFSQPPSARDSDYAEIMVREVGRNLVVFNDTSIEMAGCEVVGRFAREGGVPSVVYAPIISYGDLVGYLTCGSAGRMVEWNEEQKLFCATIANLAALVIERQERLRAESELRAEVEERRRTQREIETGRERLAIHQSTLDKLIRDEAVRSGTAGEAMRVLAKSLALDSGVERVGFWLLDDAGDRFENPEIYVVARDAFQVPASALDPDYGRIMLSVVGRQMAAVDDAELPGAYAELFAVRVANRSRILSAMYVPIVSRDEIVGYISCSSISRKVSWSEEHKLFCSTIANVAALVVERLERTRVEVELREANTAAKSASRAKSQFLANMSHEIRTPMNGVIGMADLLMRTELSQRQQRLLGTIDQSARNLLTIINDILDLSRIEEGKLVLEPHDFKLSSCVEDAVELLSEDAYKKGLNLDLFVHEDAAVAVEGDSGRLRQVLINLIGNAIKFTAAGGVSVRLEPAKATDGAARMRFTVRDTGIGIEPGVLTRLFEPFTQADTSISRRFGGTGLGLSISRHLVTMMGGQMRVDSVPGNGTEIAFDLPFAPRSRAEADADVAAERLQGVRVLVVDDRETNREIISSYLASTGAFVEQASSSDQALQLLRRAVELSEPFEVAIVDLVMPGIDGLGLGRAIGADPSISGLRRVLLSSLSWSGDRNVVREAGFDRLLHKPIRRQELIKVVAALVADRRNAGAAAEVADTEQPSLRRWNEAADAKLSLHVLLAEDNPVNQVVASEYLANLGCEVTIAENGLEALAAFERGRFDVILMDHQMPEMDGLTATRRIRDHERRNNAARTPVIAVTANAFEEDRRKGREAGMDDYISKPFSERHLRDALVRWNKHSGSAPAATAARERQPLPKVDPSPEPPARGLRPGLTARLMRIYLEHAPTGITALSQALASGDATGIKLAAHSLKSSSANVGAHGIAEACKSLELAAAEHRLNDCAGLLAQLAIRFHALKLEVESPVDAASTKVVA